MKEYNLDKIRRVINLLLSIFTFSFILIVAYFILFTIAVIEVLKLKGVM